jgi:hypothetical protein
MTLKNFLSGKTLDSVEITEEYGLIYNVFVDSTPTPYGGDVDTSNVPEGTVLSTRTDFTLENDILSVGNISVDTNLLNML